MNVVFYFPLHTHKQSDSFVNLVHISFLCRWSWRFLLPRNRGLVKWTGELSFFLSIRRTSERLKLSGQNNGLDYTSKRTLLYIKPSFSLRKQLYSDCELRLCVKYVDVILTFVSAVLSMSSFFSPQKFVNKMEIILILLSYIHIPFVLIQELWW